MNARALHATGNILEGVDSGLLLAVLVLASVGLIMIASASISFAEHNYGDAFYFVKRHVVFLCLGLGLALIVIQVPSAFWYRHGNVLLFVTVLLLIAVLIPGIGRRVNGSQRWIPLGPLTLQVSELAKLAMMVYFAAYLQRHQLTLREGWRGLIKPLGVLALIVLLLLLEPDFGSVVVLTGTVMGLLFIAGMQLWQFLLLVLAGGASLAALAILSAYRFQRLVIFLDPWADQFGSGYQLTQSLMAFGRGEWFGVGLGNSIQKLFYLPEAHTDFVFAIFAEEFGLVGVVAVIGLLTFAVTRVITVARQAVSRQEWFAGYLCFGIAILVAGQAFINIGVTSGFLPTKGLTLPFISYGGSSLLVCFVMIALVLRISGELNGVFEQVRIDQKRV